MNRPAGSPPPARPRRNPRPALEAAARPYAAPPVPCCPGAGARGRQKVRHRAGAPGTENRAVDPARAVTVTACSARRGLPRGVTGSNRARPWPGPPPGSQPGVGRVRVRTVAKRVWRSDPRRSRGGAGRWSAPCPPCRVRPEGASAAPPPPLTPRLAQEAAGMRQRRPAPPFGASQVSGGPGGQGRGPVAAAGFKLSVFAHDSSFTPCGVYLWLESRGDISNVSYRMDSAIIAPDLHSVS